ncbi:hypothetical protein KKG82_00335, partial [Patescibacteria group bacterium]|nr:hypothetical protein [Patescibacteria group bacterium]
VKMTINDKPDRMPVQRKLIEGSGNYLEFIFRNKKEQIEFYLDSKLTQKNLQVFAEQHNICYELLR